MNLISNPTPIILHGEYTLLWIFLFGMFTMFWMQVLGMKLALLGEWVDIMRSRKMIETIGGKFVGIENGSAVFQMVSPPPEQPQPPVDSEGGPGAEEG